VTPHSGFERRDRLFPRRSILAAMPTLFAGRLEEVGVASEHDGANTFRYEARRQRAGTSTLVWTAHFERRWLVS
jgi:hypothetical protein